MLFNKANRRFIKLKYIEILNFIDNKDLNDSMYDFYI